MTLKKGAIDTALCGKGFTRKKSGDHWFYTLHVDGVKTSIFTKTSHGSSGSDVDDSLVGMMARQVRLSSGQFRQLVTCTLSEKDYLQVLRDNRHIPPERKPDEVAAPEHRSRRKPGDRKRRRNR